MSYLHDKSRFQRNLDGRTDGKTDRREKERTDEPSNRIALRLSKKDTKRLYENSVRNEKHVTQS